MRVSDKCTDVHGIFFSKERVLSAVRRMFRSHLTLTQTHTVELGLGYRCEASVVGREVNVIQGLQYHTQGHTVSNTVFVFQRPERKLDRAQEQVRQSERWSEVSLSSFISRWVRSRELILGQRCETWYLQLSVIVRWGTTDKLEALSITAIPYTHTQTHVHTLLGCVSYCILT